MKNPLSARKLVGNTLLSLMGKVFPMVSAVVAIPFLIRGLGTEQFGILILIWVFVGYSSLLDLGLPRGLIKVLSDMHGQSDVEKMKVISAAASILFLFGSAIALIFFGLNERVVSQWLTIEAQHQQEARFSLYIIAGSYPLLILLGVFKASLEADEQFGIVNRLNVAYGILNYLLPATLVFFLPSLTWVVAVTVFMRLLNVGHLAVHAKRNYSGHRLTFRLDTATTTPLIAFGKWMVLATFLATGMALADRFMIGSMISMSATAYFSTPLELLMKLDILPMALVAVLFPAFTHATATGSPQTETIYNMVLKLLSFIFSISCFYLILSGEWLISVWLGPEFAEQSATVFRLLCLSSFVVAMTYIAQSLVQGVGKPEQSVFVYVALVLLGLPLTYVLIRDYSIEGAAIARLIRIIFEFGLISIIIRNVVKLRLGNATIWVVATGFGCMVCAFYVPFGALSMVLSVFFWVALSLVFWRFGFTSNERATFTNMLPSSFRL